MKWQEYGTFPGFLGKDFDVETSTAMTRDGMRKRRAEMGNPWHVGNGTGWILYTRYTYPLPALAGKPGTGFFFLFFFEKCVPSLRWIR